MVCGRRSAEKRMRREGEEEERGGRGGRGGRGQGGQREEERRRLEGSVATRKVRAKRFVECFMESFRIVDFLSPIAPGWIYDGRRTRKRTRRDVPATCAARCATENIKGYYLNSRKVRFLQRRDATRLGPRVLSRERSRSSNVSWRRQTTR